MRGGRVFGRTLECKGAQVERGVGRIGEGRGGGQEGGRRGARLGPQERLTWAATFWKSVGDYHIPNEVAVIGLEKCAYGRGITLACFARCAAVNTRGRGEGDGTLAPF